MEATARQSPVDRRGSSDVAARGKRIMRNSGSSRNDCNTSRSLSRRMDVVRQTLCLATDGFALKRNVSALLSNFSAST